jgi:hypothetical protein
LKYSLLTTIDESGKVVFRRNFPNQEELILYYFVSLDGPIKIAEWWNLGIILQWAKFKELETLQYQKYTLLESCAGELSADASMFDLAHNN